MARCLFCDIAAGTVPCDKVYADDHVLAFRDLNPQAPVHVLVIPKRHLPGLAALTEQDGDLMGRLITVAARLGEELGLANRGYRFVINNGPEGGQTVPHLHLHLLGGRALGWPPG